MHALDSLAASCAAPFSEGEPMAPVAATPDSSPAFSPNSPMRVLPAAIQRAQAEARILGFCGSTSRHDGIGPRVRHLFFLNCRPRIRHSTTSSLYLRLCDSVWPKRSIHKQPTLEPVRSSPLCPTRCNLHVDGVIPSS
ncbi:hypothetical protein T440DRAFT_211946 [Plenodomus tracheiphilus IPT5]|uniref:Uncharacterized protein n=1 Tax=Plenodomus tracheiphilus IPT5 TaxID=1408161 RepID=A0A6A7AYR0_9PLEO|nr:hypothetical protein T440DRAFT_211946 [Plenodomus tracheiphilus IPT5]